MPLAWKSVEGRPTETFYCVFETATAVAQKHIASFLNFAKLFIDKKKCQIWLAEGNSVHLSMLSTDAEH